MPMSKSRGDYVVFTDESSITAANYMVIGGVLCRTETANDIADEIQRMRGKHPFKSDSIQWKHINERKIPIYKAFIDIALGGVDTYRIHRTIAARVTTAR
jgi:hypothetical protein